MAVIAYADGEGLRSQHTLRCIRMNTWKTWTIRRRRTTEICFHSRRRIACCEFCSVSIAAAAPATVCDDDKAVVLFHLYIYRDILTVVQTANADQQADTRRLAASELSSCHPAPPCSQQACAQPWLRALLLEQDSCPLRVCVVISDYASPATHPSAFPFSFVSFFPSCRSPLLISPVAAHQISSSSVEKSNIVVKLASSAYKYTMFFLGFFHLLLVLGA
eukprot:scpid65618/ scgid16925/ 